MIDLKELKRRVEWFDSEGRTPSMSNYMLMEWSLVVNPALVVELIGRLERAEEGWERSHIAYVEALKR